MERTTENAIARVTLPSVADRRGQGQNYRGDERALEFETRMKPNTLRKNKWHDIEDLHWAVRHSATRMNV